jgi:hypothetical protein
MTDRPRPSPAGTATKLFVTGASVAAGLAVIGLIDASAEVAEAAPITPPPPTIVRRVVVATPEPDIVLQATLGGSRVVVRQAPAPIVRVRSAPAGGGAPAPAQSTSKGS